MNGQAASLSKVDATKARALAEFLFPKHGTWEWYVSPRGYKFIKITQRKEEAA